MHGESLQNAARLPKRVLIAASIFTAQGRSGAPLGQPAPPFPARAAPLWNLAETWVKPYDSAVCAGGLLGARPPGAELTSDPPGILEFTPNL